MNATNATRWIPLVVGLPGCLCLCAALLTRHYGTGCAIVLLTVGPWLSLKREPEEMGVRPSLRLLGFLLAGLGVVALLACLLLLIGRQ